MFNLFGKKKHEEPDRSLIVPRIKNIDMLAFAREKGMPEKDWPITQPLAADLLIAYAFDLPGVFQMLRQADLKRLNLKPDELKAIAVENLRPRLGKMKTESQGTPVYMLTTGDDLGACLLLFDDLWEDFVSRLPGETVVAVPSRRIVLQTSTEWPGALDLLRELVADVWERYPTDRLSDELLVRRRGSWTGFHESK